MADDPAVSMILVRVRPGSDVSCFRLYACRGEGRGCPRNKFRTRKKECEDCVETHNAETMGALIERMRRGDG